MATSTSPSPPSEGEPPEEGAPPGGHPTGSNAPRVALEWAFVVIGAVVVAVVIKTFVMQAFYIPSESMEPTLLKNDRVLVNKVSYQLHDVNRGDVVVFKRPPDERSGGVTDLIKRVIGLPGEEIFFEDDRVYIDGDPLSEPYLPSGVETDLASPEEAWNGQPCIRVAPCEVPQDSVWVMGDNRTNSEDSRYIGPVPQDAIVGRSFVVVWPPSRLGGL